MKISEMQLDDIIQLRKQASAMEKRMGMLDITDDTGMLFSESGQGVFLAKNKLLYLTMQRTLADLGVDVGRDLYKFDNPFDEDGDLDWDAICEDWYSVSEWQKLQFDAFMKKHGWDVVCDYGDIEEIYEQWGEKECSEEDERLLSDPDFLIRSRYAKDFKVDREKQCETAGHILEICSYDCGLAESMTAYRSVLAGRIHSFVAEHINDASQETTRRLFQVFEETLEDLSVVMYCDYRVLSEPYTSIEDGAYVIRASEVCFYETVEDIRFALFRPIQYVNVVLLERLCDLIVSAYPQILMDQKGGVQCA